MNFNLKNFSVYCILRDIIYNIWVIVLTCIIAVIGSSIYVNYYHKLEYTASMTVSINEKSLSAYTTTAVSKAIETASVFQTLFVSDVMKAKIEEVTGETMSGAISTSQISQTNLIQIKATADSPEGAFKTLTTVYDNYKLVTDYAFEDVVIYVLNYPVVPVAPSNSVSFLGIMLKACPLACIFICGLIVLISFLRDTIKTESAIKDILVLDIISSVYHERKNKTLKTFIQKTNKKILLTDPLVNPSYSDSFKKIGMKLEYMSRSHNKKVFTIASTNENEGKTTIAVNTAIILAQNGHKVLLIDLDLRKPAVWRFFNSLNFEDGENRHISDIIKSSRLYDDDIVYDKDSGVHLLCGKKSVTHSSEYLSHSGFKKILDKVRNDFDFVIIDTSPLALIADAEIISSYTDGVLLVVRQDNTAIDAINETIAAFNRKSSVLGCIFNDVKTLEGYVIGSNIVQKYGHYGKYGKYSKYN